MYIRRLLQKTLILPFGQRRQEIQKESIDWNRDLNIILSTVGIVSAALNPSVGLAFLGAMFLRGGIEK